MWQNEPSSSSSSEASTQIGEKKPIPSNIRYVRRPPSPKRNVSYERIRPPKNAPRSSQSRPAKSSTRPRFELGSSDDDLVYKIDVEGRRASPYPRDYRSHSREHHEARGGDYRMSGGLGTDSGSETGQKTSHRRSEPARRGRCKRWSTIAGPFRISLVQPEDDRSHKKDHGRSSGRHQNTPEGRHDRKNSRIPEHVSSPRSRQKDRASSPRSRLKEKVSKSRSRSKARPSSPCSRSKSEDQISSSGFSSKERATPPGSRSSSRSQSLGRRSQSVQPKGILRSEPESGRKPKLIKTVSFEKGTKRPDDYIARDQSSAEERSRTTIRSKTNSAKEHQDQEQRAANDTWNLPRELDGDWCYFDQHWTQSRADSVAAQSSLGKCGTSPELGDRAGFGCRHSPRRPAAQHHSQRGTDSSSLLRYKSAPQPSPSEEQTRLVVHSILLTNHQQWCRGECKDVARFSKSMGACRCCRTRIASGRQGSGGLLIPNCRTLLDCRGLDNASFVQDNIESLSSHDNTNILRIGFADVYCCSIAAYLSVEEYLVYRQRHMDDLYFALLVRDGLFRQRVAEIKRRGQLDQVARGCGSEAHFFARLANEVQNTSRIWDSIMYCARDMDEPFEEAVLDLLEDVTKKWKPVRARAKYERFWY